MKKLFVYIAGTALLAGCTKVLDKYDFTAVNEQVWENEATATLYLNRLYWDNLPTWPSGHSSTSDESNTGTSALLYGELTTENAAGDFSQNYYTFIRNINILLDEIEKGSIPKDAKDRIKGQAYFLRAWRYFNLVKQYGGVPMVMHAQDVANEDLFLPRNPTSECIDLIVQDLDQAIAVLPGTWGSQDFGRITRGAAAALKGRVLLYWASPQFNPSNLAERWQRAYEANKAAKDMLVQDGYGLFPEFAGIWLEEQNEEVIFSRSYTDTDDDYYEQWAHNTRPASESDGGGGGGSNQPSLALVNAFPMKSGRPISEDPSYDPVRFWANRDPRFDATIAYNGCVWPLSGQPGRRQWNYIGVEASGKDTRTGFYCRKMVNPDIPASEVRKSGTDWVEIRFAEVLLNLAECANGIGNQQEAYAELSAIRERAGIEPGSDGLYGLQPAMSREQMLRAIMNERMIELAFEGKRFWDLRRNRMWDQLNGTRRQGYVITPKPPYDADALEEIRDDLDFNGTDNYNDYFNTSVTNIDNKSINFRPEYYFFPIQRTNIDRNPQIQQTQGWDGGTFDPLQ